MSNEDDEVTLKVGDTVTLNTDNGPEMVISQISTDEAGVDQGTCLWFENQRQADSDNPIWVLKREVLPIDVLSLIED